METLATKYFAFWFLTVFGGGWTMPLGLPPAPEDPNVARVAPEKCLFYVSWAGTATADPKSKNQTEQLLAEPEVQRSLAVLTALLSHPASTVTLPPADLLDPDHVADRETALELAKIIAAHPGAVFVTEIKHGEAKDGTRENIGMFVAAGQDVEKLRAAFDQFRKEATTGETAPPANGQPNLPAKKKPTVKEVQIAGHTWYRFTASSIDAPFTCGFDGTDFIVGVGDGSVEEILKRRSQEPPAWLVNVRKQLPVERTSMVVYLNLKMALDQISADEAMPKTRDALRLLGLDKVSSVSSVSGLEGETFTSKLLLATDGEPQGPLLSLFSDQPLRAEDLKPIPRDATLGFAMRFDAQKAVEQFAALVEKSEPAQRAAIEGPWDALTKSLSVDLRRDLPKALGDTCCVYTSPGEGGLVILGLTAVVPIKDRDAISVIQAKILGGSLAKGFQDALNSAPSSPFQPAKPRILSFSFAGQRIFYSTNLGFGGFPLGFGGFAPAWCATEHELIVAMTPQNIMAYLQHGPEHKSLATVPQVSRLLASADAPSMIEYVDTAKLFELLYPFLPLAASWGSNFGGEKPLTLDAIPSAPAIGRHMVPGTAALRRTKQGLELVSRQPLPGTGLLWTGAAVILSPQELERLVAVEGQPQDEATFGAMDVAPPVAGPAGLAPPPAVAPAPTYALPADGGAGPYPAMPAGAAAAPAPAPADLDPFWGRTTVPAPSVPPGVPAIPNADASAPPSTKY